jgi:hypothetical protein
LVLKTDGGSEFKAEEFGRMLRRHGVTHLVSPPHYPRYNGSIEAGIGSLKTHVWYEAQRRGRVGYLTCDDVEAGRLKANETSRPWGPGGPSPDERWRERLPIGSRERAAFLGTLKKERVACAKLLGEDVRKDGTDERLAITRALERRGYLVITRRRVSLGVSG